MGGRKVLLTFTNLDELMSYVHVFGYDFDQIFSRLQRWISERPCPFRMVWVRCYGVPLSTWDKELFEEIGRSVGKVLEVAEETVEKNMPEFGRLKFGESIQSCI